MITVTPPNYPAIFSGTSRRVTSHLRKRRLLVTLCAVLAVLLCGAASIAVAQTAHLNPTITTIASGFDFPVGVAVDSSGNVYVADAMNNAVKEIQAVNGIIPPSPTIVTLGSGFIEPFAVAVDASGDVFVSDSSNALKEIVAVNGSIPPSPVIITLGSGFLPGGIAIDKQGDVFVAGGGATLASANGGAGNPSTISGASVAPGAFSENAINEILAVNGTIPASPTVQVITASVLDTVLGAAVDNNGNVFASNAGGLYEVLAVNGSLPAFPEIVAVNGINFSLSGGFAVDGGGNIFAGDYTDSEVREILAVNGSIPASPAIRVLDQSIVSDGLTLDGNGDIYLTDRENKSVLKLSRSSINFGSVNLGVTSPTQTLIFTFDTGGTLGGVSVLTQGIPNQDFGGLGTCQTNTAYTAGQICSVEVAFKPKSPGTRHGAVVLYDTNGNAIAIAYLQGTGVGPQINFLPGVQNVFPLTAFENSVTGIVSASQLAVDDIGDFYVTDWGRNQVMKETPSAGSYNQTPIGSGLNGPMGVAVDGAGNVYIADTYNNRVLLETLSATGVYAQFTIGSGLSTPMAVALDANGNVFIADYGNERVVRETLSTDGYSQSVLPFNGLNGPSGVAVDASGNVYVADVFNNRVVVGTPFTSSYIQTTVESSALKNPNGVSVDGNGNLYISDTGNDRVLRESPSSTGFVESVIDNVVYMPINAVASGNGNLVISEAGIWPVVFLDFADAPSLHFASTSVGSTSIDSPKTVTVENVGNAPLSFPIPLTGNNPSMAANFTMNSTGASACSLVSAGTSEPGTLAAGAFCQFPISFAPTMAGALSGSLVLTDNNLNATAPGYGSQSITLNGTATQVTPTINWTAPGAITYGTLLSGTQLNATSSVGGTFAYTPAAGTVLGTGKQSLTVTFTPTDSTDYTSASATVMLFVNQATPSINWAIPAAVPYGTPLSATQLNASSTVAGTFTYSPAAGTTLTAGSHLLTVNFSPIDATDYVTATASVHLNVNPPNDVIAIACGGPAESNKNGGDVSFVADKDYSGGGINSSTTETINLTQPGVNAAPMGVYQHGRAGVTTYTIPKLAAGSQHTVLLHFSENYFSAKKMRVFNVAINGTTVLTNFDIYATAGAQYTALEKTFAATANSAGDIVIAFTKGTVDQPVIMGIEVR